MTDDLEARFTAKTAELGDWRAQVLVQVRSVVHEALPEVGEAWKWVKPTNPGGVLVWSSNGDLCTAETYKAAVKLTFFKGASLPDPAGLFTSSLEGKVRRAVDITEGQDLDEPALAELFRAAAAVNAAGKKA